MRFLTSLVQLDFEKKMRRWGGGGVSMFSPVVELVGLLRYWYIKKGTKTYRSMEHYLHEDIFLGPASLEKNIQYENI